MKKNNKFGFTLVELLAVIAVLALILIIAVPKITKTLDNSKKRTLELSAKSIASAAEKAYIENKTYGINEEVTCENITNMSKNEYEVCEIEFDNEGNASVTIIGKGNYKGLKICDGTKENANISTGECPVMAKTYITNLLEKESILHNGLINPKVTYNNIEYDTGIRYSGSLDEVNNKVYYNCEDKDSNEVSYGSEGYNYPSSCEVWRIIGVFDVKNKKGEIEKRVKLINVDSTFKATWDSSANDINNGYGINQWGKSTYEDGKAYEGADLMQLLNGFYIGKSSDCKYCNEEGQAICKNICTADSLKNANMKVLTSVAKEMIDNAVWDTYGVTWPSDDVRDSSFAPTAYLQEKGISTQHTGKICSDSTIYNDMYLCTDTVERKKNWTGLIGLMYASDILYADGWLYNKVGATLYPKTISPLAISTYANHIWFGHNDEVGTTLIYGYPTIFPSLYLKSSIKIASGNGKDKPYILQ